VTAHDYKPSACPVCSSYADKYGHSDLAANLVTEQANLTDAEALYVDARADGGPAIDGLLNPSMHDSDQRRPRENFPRPAAVGREHVTGGKRWPLTSTRARPSDFDYEED
jgi:hypothetical protein